MAMLNAGTDRQIWIVKVCLLVIAFLANLAVSGSDDFVEIGGLNHPLIHTHQNATELLITRAIVETEVWKSVNGILKRLETTTCGTEAAARLYGACKAFDADSVDNSDAPAQLDKLKTLYGVRMCICETGKGGARIPTACQQAVQMAGADKSEKTRLDADLRLANNLRNCIGSLQAEHYLWTSYSNNLQDAVTLCDASRHDIDSRRLRDLYKDIMGSFHSFGDFLNVQQEVAERWLNDSEDRAHELRVAHFETMKKLSKEYNEYANLASKDFDNMQESAQAASTALAQVAHNATQILFGFYKNTEDLNLNLDILKNNLARFYTGAADDISDLLRSQMTDIEVIGIKVNSILDALNTETLEIFQESIIHTFDEWRAFSEHLHTQQDDLLSTAQTLSNLTLDTVKYQQESHDMAHLASQSMREVSAQIASMEKPFRAMSSMYNAYTNGKLRAIAIEICFAGIFLTSTITAFMFSGTRQFAPLFVLAYTWAQCMRIGLGLVDAPARALATVKFYVSAIGERPATIALFAVTVLVCILINCRQLRRAREEDARLKRREAFARGLVARGGRRDPGVVSLRAGTTPPGL